LRVAVDYYRDPGATDLDTIDSVDAPDPGDL
jgi:hypothetical protein